MANVTGWGRGTWGQLTWGEPIPVILSGLSATSALGTVIPDAEATITLTGFGLTATNGGVAVEAGGKI